MTRLAWICLGGATGTAARYLLSGWVLEKYGPGPAGTIAVNALGCLLMGALVHVATATSLLSPTLRLALTTGVLGGFTTYSAFNAETTAFVRGGSYLSAGLNVAGTLVLCFLAGLAGMAAARAIVGP